MNWHGLTVAVFAVAVAGCVSDEASVLPTPPVTRSQKPDGDAPVAGGKKIDAGTVAPGTSTTPADSVASIGKPETVRIEGQLVVKARAMVNGIPILDDELKQATYQPLMMTERLPEPEKSQRRSEIVRGELEKLIERELILSVAMAQLSKRKEAIDKLREAAAKEFEKYLRGMKERAKAQGIDVESEEKLKEMMESQGLSLDSLRRQTERGFMAMEYMRHMIYPQIEKGVNHHAIRDYYDEHPGEFQTEDRVKWRDIFIATAKYPSPAEAHKLAEQIIARVQKGEDFMALSKEYDNGDSRDYRQGFGLGEKRGEIQPREVEPILFRMREGEVGPIVENANGYHVIKLVEREYAGLHPFDEKTQSEIKKKLQGVIADREYKRILNEMKSKAQVQMLEE